MTVNINFSLSQRLGHLLAEQGLKIAVAESCTGGGLASEITAVPGSSQWFDRGFVTYTNTSKIELLGVDAKTLETEGAVSESTAKQMASGALQASHADITVSITGVAGPAGGTAEKPVGLVWFGLATRDGRCLARHANFTSGRKHVRRSAIQYALEWLLEKVCYSPQIME